MQDKNTSISYQKQTYRQQAWFICRRFGRYVFNARCRKFETLRQLVAWNTRDLLLGSKFYGWTYNFDTRDTDLTNASLEPRIIPWSCNFRYPRNHLSIPPSIAIICESVKIFITGLSSLATFFFSRLFTSLYFFSMLE